MTDLGATRRAASVAVLAAVAFIVLAVLVATGVTQPLDVAARGFFRPDREWTLAQARADILVEGLQPWVVAAVLVLVGLGTSLHHRSWLPLAHAAAVGLVGGLAALAAKLAVGRPDPGYEMTTFAGSFPSGHVLSVLVCLGGAVLVLTPRSRWWEWTVVAAAGAGMAYAMLIQSAHWLTDVTGGALLGLSVLTAASACGAGRRPVHHPGPRGNEHGEERPVAQMGVSGTVIAPRPPRWDHAGAMDGGHSLRIAIIHSFYSSRQPSGENQVVDQQVDVLANAGHAVTLIARRTDEQEGTWAYPLRAAATVATGRGPDPLDQLDELRPDVVVVNNLFPNYGRTWVDTWNGPIVAVMHNHRPMCAAGTFFREGSPCTECLDARSAWPAVEHGCYRGSRVATVPVAIGTRFGDDPLLRRADRVVVLNRRMQAFYEQSGVEPERLTVLPNFLSRPHPPGPGGGPWLFVGRLTEEKGILPMVRQWPRGIPLTLVGSGPLDEEVARAAPDSVALLGEQPASRVSELMRSAQGLVFPSKCFEGFPMVYLEALAAGTPVIAWEPSVVAGMVREDQTGLVAGDLERTLEEAERTFPAMRERCRSVFEARYTRESWLTSMEDLFHEVAGSAAR